MSRKGGSPKGELRGAYVGGGIFGILISIPLIFLFVPYFIHAVTGVFLWDPSQLGINQEMIDYVMGFVCYLLPALLFVINLICLFIARSKSSFFIKLGTLLFLAYFVINYSLVSLRTIAGVDLYTPISGIPYLGYGIVGGGALFVLLGIIFRFVDRGHPNRASGFLIFSGLFWLIAAGGEIVIPMIMASAASVLVYYEPFILAVFGLIGGLMMLFFCRKPTDVMMPEKQRKPKNDVVSVDGQNGMAAGGMGMQPQMAMQNGMMPNGMPMQGGMPGQPMAQPQMQPQPQMQAQMPNAMPQQGQMPAQPPIQGQPPMQQGPQGPQMGPRPPIQGQPNAPMGPRPPMPGPQGAPMGPRPPMQGQPPMQGPQGAPMGPRPPVQGQPAPVQPAAPANPNGTPTGNADGNPNGGTPQ